MRKRPEEWFTKLFDAFCHDPFCHKWHPQKSCDVPAAPSHQHRQTRCFCGPFQNIDEQDGCMQVSAQSTHMHTHTHNCLSLEMSSQQTVFVSQVFCCLPYYHVRQLHCGAVVPMNITPYVQFEYLGKSWWWGESYFFSVIFFDIFSQLDLQAWGRPLL